MRCALVSVLLLAVTLSAQPLTGPFTIFSEEMYNLPLGPVHLAAHPPSADIALFWRGNLMYLQADPATGTILIQPTLLRQDNPPWTLRVEDMRAVGDGWGAVMIERNPPYNRTLYYHGQNGLHELSVLEDTQDYCWNTSLCHANNPYCHALVQGRDGNTYVSWVGLWSFVLFDWAESGISMTTFGVQPSQPPVRMNDCQINWLSAQGLDRLRLYSPGLGLLFGLGSSYGHLFGWRAVTDGGWTQPSEWSCGGTLCEWLVTPGGASFALLRGDSASSSRIVQLEAEGSYTQTCMLEYPPIAWAAHENFGMAWISQIGSSNYLFRADTAGTLAYPAGMLANLDSGVVIGGSALSIASDGRITFIWSENDPAGMRRACVRMVSAGWTTPLGLVDKPSAHLPGSLHLSTFPNPFNSTLRIQYHLKCNQMVSLIVYNTIGQEVATLVNSVENAGTHRIVWNPEVPSGLYLLALRTPDQRHFTKVVYLK